MACATGPKRKRLMMSCGTSVELERPPRKILHAGSRSGGAVGNKLVTMALTICCASCTCGHQAQGPGRGGGGQRVCNSENSMTAAVQKTCDRAKNRQAKLVPAPRRASSHGDTQRNSPAAARLGGGARDLNNALAGLWVGWVHHENGTRHNHHSVEICTC